MVALSLVPTKGNGARYFPYQGFLGLTEIKIDGVVRTRIEDGKALPAKTITVSVRCYESRQGRVASTHTNILVDYTQVLWTKPDEQEYEDVGDADLPFRITIPSRVAGHSTASFQDYRIWWRVEATLHHIPLVGVGNRQTKHLDLPLIRYDVPPQHSTPPSLQYLGRLTSKPRSPAIRYHVSVPTGPVGPQDLVSIPISLQPLDSSVSIRSASLIVERRIHINETSASSSSSGLSPTLSIPIPTHQSQSHSASSSYSPITPAYDNTHNLDSHYPYSYHSPSPNTSTIFSDDTIRPLLPTPTLGKSVTQCVVGVEPSGRFTPDGHGVCTKTLTLQWPSVKSQARWALGETIQTEMASVKFFVRVKIIVSSPSGTESIDLEDQELLVVSTNDAERQLASSKYNQQLFATANATYRSKSKSPRRIRRDREPLPSPPPSDDGPSDGLFLHPKSAMQGESSRLKSSGLKAKKSRRPHTSAGPSDKSSEFRLVSSPYERQRPDEQHPFNPSEVAKKGMPLRVAVNMDSVDANLSTAPSSFTRKRTMAPVLNVSASSNSSSSQSHHQLSGDERPASERSTLDKKQVRAWEQELAHVEAPSRRSSLDLFGIFKRKRVHLVRGA